MSSQNPKINIPVVSAIIERIHNGRIQILIQTRWKPDRDPIYSGTLEIPAGWINEYESVFDAVRREVYEETGLIIKKIKHDKRSTIQETNKGDSSFAFVPFCCHQQLKGGKPWIGFVFLCEVEDTEPIAQTDEVRDVRWINKEDLFKIFIDTPEKIFTLQLGVFNYYFNKKK